MTTKSSSSRSTGVWPSMPVPAVQNAISPVSRVDQPVAFVVGLVSQRVHDLFQIEAAQV
jgi:hypothetical protein